MQPGTLNGFDCPMDFPTCLEVRNGERFAEPPVRQIVSRVGASRMAHAEVHDSQKVPCELWERIAPREQGPRRIGQAPGSERFVVLRVRWLRVVWVLL